MYSPRGKTTRFIAIKRLEWFVWQVIAEMNLEPSLVKHKAKNFHPRILAQYTALR